MAIPPERISLKRRRADEAVDYLRFDSGKGNKRRHTNFVFQRQENNTIPPVPRKTSQPLPLSRVPQSGDGQGAYGIPSVRSNTTSDEIKALAKLRAAHKQRLIDAKSAHSAPLEVSSPQPPATEKNSSSPPIAVTDMVSEDNVRRFHLTANLTDTQVNPSTRFKSIRPTIATFVEKHLQQEIGSESDPHHSSHTTKLSTTYPNAPTSSNIQGSEGRKVGQSMLDHPSTWDLESDQLADELAAFALELDPGTNHHPEDVASQPLHETQQPDVDVAMIVDDDYVYETYVRVPYQELQLDPMIIDPKTNIGLLVIDEEAEALWEEYLNAGEDDDDEWDEEDSNAEDNPANDYPEDEVGSDDEHGHNPYRHRNQGSDNEFYDEDYDD